MAVITEFIFNGPSVAWQYKADVVRLIPEYDADTFRRIDGVVERDIRRIRFVLQWEALMVNENDLPESASDLYDKIRYENAQGNSVEVRPDKDASAPNSFAPSMECVTRGGPPDAYRLDQSQKRFQRSFEVQSAKWYDPSVTADNEVIEDLFSLDELV